MCRTETARMRPKCNVVASSILLWPRLELLVRLLVLSQLCLSRIFRKPGNKWALTEAKKNLINNYFLVGVTEELEDFIAVLETSLPRIFKGALEHYTRSNKSHLRQTVQKNAPTVETVNKFKSNQVWQMENEFYEFVLDNFHFIKKQTLKNQKQHVIYEKIRPRQS